MNKHDGTVFRLTATVTGVNAPADAPPVPRECRYPGAPVAVAGPAVLPPYDRVGTVTSATVHSVGIEVLPLAPDLGKDNEVGRALRDPYRPLLEDLFPARLLCGPLKLLDIGSRVAAGKTWEGRRLLLKLLISDTPITTNALLSAPSALVGGDYARGDEGGGCGPDPVLIEQALNVEVGQDRSIQCSMFFADCPLCYC